MRHFPISLPLFALSALLVLPVSVHAASVSIQNVNPMSGISAGTHVTFNASASGFTDPTFTLSDSFPGSSVTGTDLDQFGNFSWTPVATDGGAHALMVTATDKFNHAASSTVHVYVIPDALTVSSISPGSVAYVKEPVTFTVAAPGFTNPLFTISDAYAGSSVTQTDLSASGTFSWRPLQNEQGSHVLTLNASDMFGHRAQTSVTLSVRPPSIAFTNVSPATTVAVGTPVTWTASSTGLSSPAYALTDSLGIHSSVNASTTNEHGAGYWKPLASDIGTHVLTLTGTDANGSSARTALTVTVVLATSTATAVPTPASTETGSATAHDASPTPSAYTFTTYLGIGSKGAAVTNLQQLLTKLDFYSGPVTGYFGPMTAAGLKRFQAAHGIEQVGFAGPQTRRALSSAE